MSITSEELAKTIQRELHFTPTESEALALAAALGIAVEDPKPEPGIYLHENGQIVILIGDGCKEGSQYIPAVHNSYWVDVNRDKLTPARVVPAEPVELTEEQVAELWGTLLGDFRDINNGWHEDTSKHITRTVNAALAKHGHGVA